MQGAIRKFEGVVEGLEESSSPLVTLAQNMLEKMVEVEPLLQ